MQENFKLMEAQEVGQEEIKAVAESLDKFGGPDNSSNAKAELVNLATKSPEAASQAAHEAAMLLLKSGSIARLESGEIDTYADIKITPQIDPGIDFSSEEVRNAFTEGFVNRALDWDDTIFGKFLSFAETEGIAIDKQNIAKKAEEKLKVFFESNEIRPEYKPFLEKLQQG